MLDLRVFLVAAVLASPAVFRAADGTLPMEEALTRVLLVMLGATAVSLLVRTLWPLLAGPTPEPERLPEIVPTPVEDDLTLVSELDDDGLGGLFSPRPE
ncbi:hypothetical protein GUY44_21425 [Pimelobacter simplex]|uniref:Uncharacterized protein n=1 Tax=Nocardioides simplex TaxID=2045 RepID=A0A0A1DIC4_NOCSI|nr:hypothetical protein [Pimelobacter simplex]AIY16308.1 hypothetical protein KR76_05235 [Pimelobacter simplex]MCG8153058.1 hypothetical protein [Pimelobacter simplex]GEB12022.1 hypothetical protein NSI01_03370 [Pimelobacter simplex]SFN04620.1 hypothetical protein SAMN05421671_4883 [Pimelobacter simplex]